MKYFFLEFYKMKRRGIFFSIFALLLLEVLWCTFPMRKNLLSLAANPTEPMWEALLLVTTTLKGLFFPIIIAIAVCRINDTEHRGNTWKLLESSAETKEIIWSSKFFSVFFLISVAQIIEFIYLILFGKTIKSGEVFPIIAYSVFLIGSLIINAVIILVQQFISIMIENQLIAMAVGMLGGFLGLFSSFFPSAIRYWLIWGYYTNLSPATFSSGGHIVRIPISIMAIIIPLIVTVFIYFVGRKYFTKKES